MLNNRVSVIEVLGEESRKTGAFTRGNVLEPYPAECIAAAAEDAGFEVEVIQIGASSDEEIVARIIGFNPFCVGMTTFTYSVAHAQKLAKMITSALPNVIVVAGGYHPSLSPETVLEESEIDFCVIGEGEITFCELLSETMSDQNWAKIKGIAYKIDGKTIITEPRERVRDLDILPWAKRSECYLKAAGHFGPAYPSLDHQVAVAEVSCSRGCHGVCTFCVSSVMMNDRHGIKPGSECSVTLRSPQNVAKEMRHLLSTFGVNLCYLTDLTFNHSVKRVKAICQALIDEGLHFGNEMDSVHTSDNMHWYCLAKVGIDEETANLMALAGCSKLGMGVETFTEAQAVAYGKTWRGIDQVRNSLLALDRAGIITRALMVLGAPNESEETVDEIIRGLCQNPVDQVRVSFLTPFPGTRIAGMLDDSEIIEKDWSQWDTDHPVVRCKLSKDELVAARARIGREFYGSPEYKERCCRKIERFPWLRESYRWWADYLHTSKVADIREAIV
ncbi:MAG: radical SAM protein [bacterium]|nr:radical SAM protein [bacterium]